MDWKALVIQVASIALATNPKTAKIAPYVGPAILETEELFKHKPKTEKLTNATNLVKISLNATNAQKPGTVDTAVTDHLIASAVSVVVDTANLIHKNPTLAPAP